MRTSVAAARRHDGMPIYRKFWAVWRPFFTVNKDKSKAWGWLVLMMILLIFESGTLVAFSYTQVRRRLDVMCSRVAVPGKYQVL